MLARLSILLLGLLMTCSVTNAGAAPRSELFPLKYSPYPLRQNIVEANVPFFNVFENGRRGHNSPRGGVYWEDETYADNRVLLSLTENFNASNHPVIIVYLHGNLTRLERDLIGQLKIPQQVSDSGVNALLVAPQFAVDALDSSAGQFAEPDYFAKFINEVAATAARWQGDEKLKLALAQAPILLMAFSGGYLPAALALERGGVTERIKGVILLDALYGEEDVFSSWLQAYGKGSFLFSAYTQSTRPLNEQLQENLHSQCIAVQRGLPEQLEMGGVYFVDLGDNMEHQELQVQAWCENPVRDILQRMRKTRLGNETGPASALCLDR